MLRADAAKSECSSLEWKGPKRGTFSPDKASPIPPFLISERFTSCMPPVIGIPKHTRGHTRREVIGVDRDG